MLSSARRFAASDCCDAVAGAPRCPPNRPPEVLQPHRIATDNVHTTLSIGDRQHAFVRCAPERQAHLEMCAVIALANERDRAAVRLDTLRDDREADPGAADGAALGTPPLVERFE